MLKLWGKNQTQTKVVKNHNSVISLVEEILKSQPEANPDEHYMRVQKLLRNNVNTGFSFDQKQKLDEMGFRVFVKGQWIAKFKYHANIWSKNRGAIKYPSSNGIGGFILDIFWDSITDDVKYAADIPDSVLDKTDAIIKSGLVDVITIHSMQVFPVEFVKCDPILIGWRSSPQVYVDNKGKFLKLFQPNSEGVMIAVWDYDKEFCF